MEDLRGPFCNMTPEWYMGDLLTLAHDLADRLILAFDQTNSGLPHPRVHLIDGVPENGRLDTCTAGLFGFLTRLTRLIHTTFLPSKWNLYPKIQFLS